MGVVCTHTSFYVLLISPSKMFKPECDVALKFWNCWYHTSVVLCINWLCLRSVNMSEYNWLRLGSIDILLLISFEHLSILNSLNVYMFYIRAQCVPCSKHCPPRLYKTILFMVYKANSLLVLRSIHNTQMQCEHHIEFLNVKPGGRKVTTKL